MHALKINNIFTNTFILIRAVFFRTKQKKTLHQIENNLKITLLTIKLF